jgi:AraC-like DNA-binding protein
MSVKLPEIIAMGYYNTDIAVKNKTVTLPRRATMFEIELSDSQGGISHIDGDSHAITRDTLILGKPGQIRKTRLPYKCYYLHMIVEDRLLREMLLSHPSFSEAGPEIKGLFERIFSPAVQGSEVLLYALVLELVYAMNKDSSGTLFGEPKRNNAEAVNRAIGYAREHLAEELSLAEISKLVGFSQIHFHNVFKASTGLTLHKFVENERISRAANLLVTTEKSLSEIAAECGFSSQSYLNYAFKRKTGKTPREYAREKNEKYGK